MSCAHMAHDYIIGDSVVIGCDVRQGLRDIFK